APVADANKPLGRQHSCQRAKYQKAFMVVRLVHDNRPEAQSIMGTASPGIDQFVGYFRLLPAPAPHLLRDELRTRNDQPRPGNNAAPGLHFRFGALAGIAVHTAEVDQRRPHTQQLIALDSQHKRDALATEPLYDKT